MQKKVPIVLILVVIVGVFCIYNDYGPTNEDNAMNFSDEVLFTQANRPLEYAHSQEYDLNHDGKITKKEMADGLGMIEKTERMRDANSIAEYKAISKDMANRDVEKSVFVNSLASLDKALIEGLSFNEAKQAINLPNEFKRRALQMPMPDRVHYIKKAIEVERHS